MAKDDNKHINIPNFDEENIEELPQEQDNYEIPNYDISETWFIEYAKYGGLGKYGIMTRALKAILLELKKQGVKKVGAVSFPENIASTNILIKLGFEKITAFDQFQDYFELK